MSNNVVLDCSLSVESRLLYKILEAKADNGNQVKMSVAEMGEYLSLSRFPISRRILPELTEKGLIQRVDRGCLPAITVIVPENEVYRANDDTGK